MLKQIIEWPLQYADLFTRADTTPPKGVLLTGKTGTGKTLLAKRRGQRMRRQLHLGQGPRAALEVGRRIGAHGARGLQDRAPLQPLHHLLRRDRGHRRRRGGGEHNVTERVISQLLTEMDGIEELRGVVVLAATNRPDLLDTALLRAGRFEIRLDLPMPDEKGRKIIFDIHTLHKPLADDVDIDKLAGETEGFAGADIEAVARRASMSAISEFLEAHVGEEDPDSSNMTIEMRHFEGALEGVRNLRATTS